ncbi:beta-N-acetyl-D-glucosaminide beta-1,4-N-acetylglucosaminyl-transferase-like [Pecten maximus]|uniref:beta-N-acetyl-D-glucosaminide beta-1,4-N-acetylglucosaminyl-transferase-like n=1 Tax=Pecten maximus TaxID=6579 RepID=UPI00145890A5|nr:beta-N-acetyl-D-glucosaminide beta-1,4-N-acetylglucosaminyl-transferase-like [Pecten maximus]
MKVSYFGLAMRRCRCVSVFVLVPICYILCMHLKESYIAHQNFVIAMPVDNLDSCHRTLHYLERQPVEETEVTLEYLERLYSNRSLLGGHFRPSICTGVGRTAIIIPYRDRKKHLLQYLNNVLPKLLRQQIDFTIFVIEQSEGSSFNRGLIRNVGFVEAMKSGPFDCFIFNDVDTIIEDDRNIFYCNPNMVRHMVSGVDRDGYKLPYYRLVGGIIGFTPEQFQHINGYSNLFFLWGAEDDDLYRRIVGEGLLIERPPNPIATITTLKHVADPIFKARLTIYESLEGLLQV